MQNFYQSLFLTYLGPGSFQKLFWKVLFAQG